MHPVIEQANQALQLGRFEAAKTLVSAALEETEVPGTRLALLEVLAQAQTGLQEHAAAAHAWQDAYQHAAVSDDKTRVFEQARQAIHDQQDYSALLRLAQDHLPHIRTPQEHAVCLLAAGEALIHLQRYQEAREAYLEPALDLAGVTPETRLHLWHYLGLGHLAEHRFMDAAAAFRQSADLALGQHFASSAANQASQRTQLHHLRNAARFYEGVIHLIYQRPQQAIQSFQELQRPLTSVGALNVALFLGMAYRTLQQPEAATRALQSLARTATSPDTLRGPAAIVRAGISNLQEAPAAIGEQLEAALDAPLQPRTSWEPSWRALFYRELGMVFHRLSCREAAITCGEEGLLAVAQRLDVWAETAVPEGLQGTNLLTTLAAFPGETWSALAQGEMVQLLQSLAWLYAQTETSALTDTALALALRLATTPEQEVVLWGQRCWFLALGVSTPWGADGTVTPTADAMIASLQDAQARCVEPALWESFVRGLAALVQGDMALASATLVHVPSVPNFPELQVLCTAVWFWAHTQQASLEQALRSDTASATMPWQTPITLALALETLLAWSTRTTAEGTALPWLASLLVQQPTSTLDVIRMLCRPGYLPASQYAHLIAELTRLSTQLEDRALADQVAVLLGGPALMERIEAMLAELDQQLAAPAAPQAARQRKPQRQRRAPSPAENLTAQTAHVLQLIGLLHNTPQAMERRVPDMIYGWLLQYSHLCTQAPEVVGALLGLLRQSPSAATVIPALLEEVPLSRRQRQALEATLNTPGESPVTGHALLIWEDRQQWPLGRLFEALADFQRSTGPALDTTPTAWSQYMVALALARVELVPRAMACLQACLQMAPQHPLAHYALAYFLRAQGQQDAALHHVIQAWHGLQALGVPVQLLHLEILKHILTSLETTHQYAQFPEWLAAFEQVSTALHEAALTPAQQQRVHEEEGSFALLHASYLATTASLDGRSTASTAAQQLACLEQAVAWGTPDTRHTALHRQAELLVRLYRYVAATAAYQALLQQWPDDQRARQRLDLWTTLQNPASAPMAIDTRLADALSAVANTANDPSLPVPLTPESALGWLQQAAPQGAHVLDVLDILTAHGGVAIQRQEWQRAIELLTPLYILSTQPQQAYYLAVAYHALSQQSAIGSEALQASEQAMQYVHYALTADPTLADAMTLLRQLEIDHQTLLTVQSQEHVRLSYSQRVCTIFEQHGVPVQEQRVAGAAEAPWVSMQEFADVDEGSGKLVTVVQLLFNAQAVGTTALPDDADVTLYAQHQRDKQRLVEAYGIEALPWPHTAYEGSTDFATLFPERLGLNRDVLFIAFADLHALIRYARILQYIAQNLPQGDTLTAATPAPVLAATARYVTLFPLLRQRLEILAAATSSKVIQRQISGVCDLLTAEPSAEPWLQFPAFVDAYGYFHAIVETMRAHLDTPPAERPSVQHEERQPPRPARRKRRPSKDRWREGEPERRREGYFSDVL